MKKSAPVSAVLISALDVQRAFGAVRAVDGLTLEVRSGEIYGLVGPDGAGKTTSMRLFAGALLPDSGAMQICGFDLASDVESARSTLGYLSQRFSLYEDLTVLENIRFFAEVRGLPSAEWLPRCLEILEFVGLDEFVHRRAGQLSGGMKQKLGLATALVTRPRVLLLDEPTTGVDPVTRQDFWQLLIRLVAVSSNREADRVAVLISTPYMDEASRCHRIGFMDGGRLIAEGTPGALRARLSGRVLELRGAPLSLLRSTAHQNADVEDVQAFGDHLHLRVRERTGARVVKQLRPRIERAGGKVDALQPIPALLEDVFISLTGSPHA